MARFGTPSKGSTAFLLVMVVAAMVAAAVPLVRPFIHSSPPQTVPTTTGTQRTPSPTPTPASLVLRHLPIIIPSTKDRADGPLLDALGTSVTTYDNALGLFGDAVTPGVCNVLWIGDEQELVVSPTLRAQAIALEHAMTYPFKDNLGHPVKLRLWHIDVPLTNTADGPDVDYPSLTPAGFEAVIFLSHANIYPANVGVVAIIRTNQGFLPWISGHDAFMSQNNDIRKWLLQGINNPVPYATATPAGNSA